MAVIKAIKENGGYMTVEYKPYERTPIMVTFGVWSLLPSILGRLTSLKRSGKRKRVWRRRSIKMTLHQRGR
jgi:hypothetical protein